jgi:peptide/nickel transport system substrate-binding protein
MQRRITSGGTKTRGVTGKLRAAAAACVTALALDAGAVAAQTPVAGGTLNFGVVAEPANYDCHASSSFALIHPIAPHYSLLVKFDARHYPSVIPDLAEHWSVSADGLTYIFKIRRGVTFHDGSSLTSADIKASYERIINPPPGVVSVRRTYYAGIDRIETPDPFTVVFTLKTPTAGMLEAFASPFNCIYSAARLKENPRYPEAEILGTGPFTFAEHIKGASWTGKRFGNYFMPGRPYLDGYKAFFVKPQGVVPGILGGQFDAEFSSRTPPEEVQLRDKMKTDLTVHEGHGLSNLSIIFNTQRKPFNDVRVRQALSMAIDRWGGAAALSKISPLKYVGGIMRPGYAMALPETELVKLPGFSRDVDAARERAKKLLAAAGIENLKFKLLNRDSPRAFAPGASYVVDQWHRIGVTAEQEPLDNARYQDLLGSADFDVAIGLQVNAVDDPTAQFATVLSRRASASGFSGHADTHIDELFAKQQHMLDQAQRTLIVNDMERYALVQAYSVPLLWWQRIVVYHKKIQGWYMTPSPYLGQDLSTVWLDER